MLGENVHCITLTGAGSGVAVVLSGCVEQSKSNLRVLDWPHLVTAGGDKTEKQQKD